MSSVPTKAELASAPELVLQTGHTMKVNCAVFAPDGRWLATGGADNAIKIWDVASGRELRALIGHTGWIKSLAVSRNGEWLATGSNDRTIRIWNVSSGQLLNTLSGHAGPIDALAFSPDNHWLASGSADNTIKIWDLTNGREAQILKSYARSVTCLAFSGDGRFLASGSADNTVKLWDAKEWSELRIFRKHTEKVTAIVFSSDNRLLVSASADGSISVWRTDSDRERFAMKHNTSATVALGFTSGTLLAAAHADGAIELWDANTGKEKRVIPASAATEEIVLAAFSPDGKLLASSTGNRSVDLREAENGKTLRTFESRSTGFYAVAFSRDGRWLASGTNDRTIRLWQVATGRELPRLTGHTGWVSTIAFSADSHFLASGSISGEVKVWDLLTGHESFALPPAPGGINALAFSPDGKLLATGGMQTTVQLWDLATKRARTFGGHTGEITAVAFSPDGRLVLSGSTDKTIRLWDANSGNVIKVLNLSDQVNAIAFSPNGKWLAAGSADKTVSLWEVETGRLVKTMAGHNGEVLAVSFSPDGQRLASGSSDGSVRLWESASGQEAGTLRGGSGVSNSVTFSHDGRWLVSGSDDGSMTVWNPASGALMATLLSMRDSDDWLVVTPDGLFDGSPSAWNLILWRFARNTFSNASVESFFNEFYYPGVLADILAGKNPRATQDITQKDRRQPTIKVELPDTQRSASKIAVRNVTVKLEIAEAPPDEAHANSSGARDLRLFRNGLLVQAWSGDILNGLNYQTIEANVPLVAGDNHLTAYAFNHDNVKSADATLTLVGADNLKRTGTAYVLSVGVGHYENSQYNLNYSVADAVDVGEQFKNQQERLGRYNPIVVIPLLNEEATKQNILLALKRMAGADSGPLPQGAPASLAKIRAVQPEDAVVVYFSGHGTAQKDRFYLIPHDLGYKGSRTALDAAGLQTILLHSISDVELEAALKPIDANQLLLVIDACNSGQALEAEEKRRGPMNTKGLAQLAYEKGMYVLTASQSIEVAFESEALKHSYLAYALVEEGIKSGAADLDHDGDVLLREWFDYATERVPLIGREKRKRGKELEEVYADEQKVQRPRVFYTRESGGDRLVIAKVGGARTQ